MRPEAPVCAGQAKKKPAGGVAGVHNRTDSWQILQVLRGEGTALARAASAGSQAAIRDQCVVGGTWAVRGHQGSLS